MLKKVFLLVMILCAGFAATVLADVPDPGPHPRPRPRPYPYQRINNDFSVLSVKFHNTDEFADKLVVDFKYRAPELSEISYRLTALDSVCAAEHFVCEDGNGTFSVEFPKLTSPGWLQAELRITCCLKVQATPYGLKQTAEPVYQREETKVFLIENKDGVCDISLQ